MLAGGSIASLMLAWLSYRVVEQPFRRSLALSPRILPSVSALAIALLLIGAIVTVHFRGFPGRIDGVVQNVLAYQDYDYRSMFREGTCFLRPEQGPSDVDFAACLPNQRPQFVLWGDSDLAQLFYGLEPLLAHRGIALGQLTASACPPLVGIGFPSRPNCRPFNDAVLDKLLKWRPDAVILGADTIPASDFEVLDNLIEELRNIGVKVVVLGPTPSYVQTVPVVLANRLSNETASLSSGDSIIRAKTFDADALMAAHFSRPGTKYVSVLAAVCPRNECPLMTSGVPISFDSHHLTKEGSRLFSSQLIGPIMN
jgi:hypothetical protein